MNYTFKMIRRVAGKNIKSLYLPIVLSCVDALLHMGKQAVDVPFQMTVHPPDAIGKTVHFLGAENAVLHPSHNVPPAGRANVDGKMVFLHNAPPVWL